MEIKYLTGASFSVWGEEGSQRRFLRWDHPDLGQPVTLLLETNHISQLIDALQRTLPPGTHSKGQSIQ